MKTTPLTRPLSILTDQLLVASNNAVTVLCSERNPDSLEVNRLLSLKYLLGWSETIFSKIFEGAKYVINYDMRVTYRFYVVLLST